jgi:hypothetical protein
LGTIKCNRSLKSTKFTNHRTKCLNWLKPGPKLYLRRTHFRIKKCQQTYNQSTLQDSIKLLKLSNMHKPLINKCSFILNLCHKPTSPNNHIMDHMKWVIIYTHKQNLMLTQRCQKILKSWFKKNQNRKLQRNLTQLKIIHQKNIRNLTNLTLQTLLKCPPSLRRNRVRLWTFN